MTHLTQDKEYNCSQTCVAMLSNKSIREIEEIVGHDIGIDVFDLNHICKKVSVRVGKWKDKKSIFFPLNCIVHVVNRKDPNVGHAIIRKNGKFLDPNGTTYYIIPRKYLIKYQPVRTN